MERKGRDIFILTFLVFLLIVLNYSFLDRQLVNFLDSSEIVHVERVIDGDTIETTLEENKTSIRLLGINTPERGEFLYEEAKEFLENIVLNKSVGLEFTSARFDKYGRLLAYVNVNRTNVNVELVRQGFANYYFYDGRDKHSSDLEDAWNECLEKGVNLCMASENSCSECIMINTDTITNSCAFDCDINEWSIKGEGREKWVFNQTLNPNERADFSLDLSDSGGSLFLRDAEGKLVGWE